MALMAPGVNFPSDALRDAHPAITTEMQTQMVTFVLTGGTTIAITDTTVVQ